MHRWANVRRPSRRRKLVVATALVAVAVGSVIVLGAASGRSVSLHRVGGAASAHTAMSSTQRLSRAGGHASYVSRGSTSATRHSSFSSASSLFSSLASNIAGPRFLAATGCGAGGSIADASGFEAADGNLAVDGGASCQDWNSFSPTWGGSAPFQSGTATLGGLTFVGATDAVNSTSDTIYAGGVKQDTECPGTVTGKANDKADLARIYVAGETVGGHTYLFLAWERQLDTTVQSDVFVSFEFNQGKLSCGATSPFVKRTKGDLLFDYNFQSGKSTIDAEQWDGTTWQALTTPPFQASVNSGTVTDTIGPSGSVDLTKFEFGEAGIDLSALDLTGNGGRACETFGSVLGGSRTSQSGDTAQLKDFVGPAPVDLSNCATPAIVTTQEPASGSTGDTFKDKATISGLVTPTGDGTLTFKLYSQKDCKGTPVDTETVTNINANGNYETPTGIKLSNAGTYYWVASFSGDDFNNPSSSGCNDEPVEVSAPGLNVFKSADHNTVSAGDPLGFTITVSNGGPGTAFGVTLKDPLPAGTTAAGWKLDSNSGSATCAIKGAVGSQELDCSAIDLAANASYTVHVSAATSFADCTVYDNTATASAENAPDATGSDSIQCNKPSLSVTKKADNATVDAGDPLGFKITVSNGGPGTAKGVTLADPLPAGTTATGWSIDSNSGSANCVINGAVGSQELDCSAVDLASGASYVLHISAATSFAACTVYDNTATAHSTNAPDASGEDTVTCEKPSLSVVKKADAASVDAGDPLGFSVTVSNGGPGTAKGVTLDDPLPAGTTAAGWKLDSNSGSANCAVAGAVGSQKLDCSAVDLGSGESYVLHVSAATSFADCTVYDNMATASASNAPDASGEDRITCSPAQVSIAKTADHSAPVNAGDQVGFTVEVKNTGSGTATGVSLADPLPAGSGSGVTWTIDSSVGTPSRFVLSGAQGSQTLSLASDSLPAGADYTVHLTAQTSQTECGTYDNTATLTTGNAGNPNPASAEESCVFQVDLAISKSGSPARQEGLGNITWTMLVTNNGPDTDTGVTISDPMPAGNTFVSAQSSQGSCTGGAILHCTIGTMTAGQKVTITLITTPSAAGTQTNTAVVMGDRPETTLTNNTATASVVVVQPHVIFCVAVSRITPGQLIVGRKTTLTIHLTRHGQAVKGVRVRIKGPKLNTTTKRANSKGVIKKTVKLKKAGILTVIPLTSPSCGTKRIGVRGIFTPPVTG